MDSPTPRVLLIENGLPEAALRGDWLRSVPSDMGLSRAANLAEARLMLARAPFDVLLLGLGAQDLDHMLPQTLELAGEKPLIVLTEQAQPAVASAALKTGAQDHLVCEELTSADLVRSVQYAIERQQSDASLRLTAARTRALLTAVPDLIIRMNGDGTFLDYKPALHFPTFVPPEEFIGQQVSEVMPGEVGKRALEYIRIALATGEVQIFEYELPVGSEHRRFESRLIASGRDEVLAIIRDITERERVQQRLESYAERLQVLHNIERSILAAQSPEAIVKATLRHVQGMIPCQRSSIAVFEKDTGQITVFATHGVHDRRLGTGTLYSRESYGDLDLLQGGRVQVVNDLWELEQPSQDIRSLREENVRAYIRVPLISEGALIGALSLESYEAHVFTPEHVDIASEVADSLAIAIVQAQLFAQVQHLAITDELTSLYNRRHFFELARREFERVQRYGGELSAIMLDIDQFKQVNDTFGHSVGDQVLRHIASQLRQSVRETDILGRYGGDEFVVLLPETNYAAAIQLAERLRFWVSQAPLMTRHGPITVKVSPGVACVNREISDLSALIDRADADMLASKQTR
jgi:diguanylate cyclase (GGDEF)-like protein/PAS domain S-box-containing protein